MVHSLVGNSLHMAWIGYGCTPEYVAKKTTDYFANSPQLCSFCKMSKYLRLLFLIWPLSWSFLKMTFRFAKWLVPQNGRKNHSVGTSTFLLIRHLTPRPSIIPLIKYAHPSTPHIDHFLKAVQNFRFRICSTNVASGIGCLFSCRTCTFWPTFLDCIKSLGGEKTHR